MCVCIYMHMYICVCVYVCVCVCVCVCVYSAVLKVYGALAQTVRVGPPPPHQGQI